MRALLRSHSAVLLFGLWPCDPRQGWGAGGLLGRSGEKKREVTDVRGVEARLSKSGEDVSQWSAPGVPPALRSDRDITQRLMGGGRVT